MGVKMQVLGYPHYQTAVYFPKNFNSSIFAASKLIKAGAHQSKNCKVYMRTNIISINELGKKVAFVNGNRAINKKNLKQKMVSIKECGQLTPIIIVDGEEAVKEELTLLDYETGKKVPAEEVANYVVVIEGQHRYTSIMELRKLDEKDDTSYAPSDIMAMYALNSKNKTIKKLISELNKTSIIWDGKDYVTGAALCNPSSELLQFAKELTDMKSVEANDGLPKTGYPVSTISKLVTFNTSFNKEKLAQSMEAGTECLPNADIERAKKILETARGRGFKHSYLSHKYFIDWFIDEQTGKGGNGVDGAEVVCQMINKLEPADVERISKIKSNNYIFEIREIVKEALNKCTEEQ